MPRIFGHDLFAVLASIIAIYAVGFVIYGVLVPDFWMALSGYTEESFIGTEWKMALSPIMPILTTLSLAWLNQTAGSTNLKDHMKIALAGFVGFSGVALLYNWVYSPMTDMTLLMIDSAHLLIGAVLGSVVLVWRKTPSSPASETDSQ